MTLMEIAKRFDLQPKDVTVYIQTNATFPVKRNFQTGELTIPDDVDIESFIAPLIQSIQDKKDQAAEQQARQKKEEAERIAQQEKEEAERIAQQRKYQTELRLLQEDLEKQQAEQLHAVAIEKLKKEGAEGYYQYKVISLVDEDGGYVDVGQLTMHLNALGIEGWHLVSAYSNEIGRNSSSSGVGGFSSGTNSTVDQNILILERFVKF